MVNILFRNRLFKEFQNFNASTFFKLEEIANKGFDKDIDTRIHETLLRLNDKEINSISIPISITENFLELSGLRLGHHIRLTKDLLFNKIPIVFFGSLDEKQLLKLSSLANILLTPNVFYVNLSIESFNSIENAIKELETERNDDLDLRKYLEKVNFKVPANYQSHHSIDNEFCLFRWCEFLGISEEIPAVQNKLKSGLYFKFLTALNPIKTNIQYGKISINKKAKILLIDDQYCKGWKSFYQNYFNSSNNNIDFECLEIDYNSLSKKDIIKEGVNKIKEFDPHIILLDLRLSDEDFDVDIVPKNISGSLLLKEIKNYDRGIQVIILTASNKSWNYKTTMELGASDYVLKSRDTDPLKDLTDLKRKVEESVDSSLFLKKCFSHIRGLKEAISSKDSIIGDDQNLINNIDSSLEIVSRLLERIYEDRKYLSFAFLQLFHVIEYYLQSDRVFYFGNNSYVNVDDENDVLVLSVIGEKDKRKTYKSAIKWGGNGHYKIGKSKYQRAVDINFKMSATLIFKYGFQTSGSQKWTKINNNRNSKAGHAGGNISQGELIELLDFMGYIFDKNKINKENIDKGLPKPSIEEEKKKLLEKFNSKF